MQYGCTEILWRDPEARCCVIYPSPSPHVSAYNARPHVTRICRQFLEAENVTVLSWPTPDMSSIENVWDALDRQRVPVPTNILQHRRAIEVGWDNIPQATINSLIKSMWRRCVALHEANGGYNRFCGFVIHNPVFFVFLFKGIWDQRMHICIPSHVKSID